MQLLMSGLAALIMLGICGLGTFFIVVDERRGREARAAELTPPSPTAQTRDIGSRAADPAPLTTNEVFPYALLRVAADGEPYRVRLTHADTDCHTAATGQLADLLDTLGCSQVVRADLIPPADGLLVTAGVFNLSDAAGADRAHEQVKPIVDTGRGRFGAGAARPAPDPLANGSAQVGWNVRGHFLVYCVVARADGHAVPDDDPSAQRIISDLIQRHLRDGVLGRRATVAVADASA